MFRLFLWTLNELTAAVGKFGRFDFDLKRRMRTCNILLSYFLRKRSYRYILFLFHPNRASCDWLASSFRLAQRSAPCDPVRRGCDRSQLTRIRWNEVRWDEMSYIKAALGEIWAVCRFSWVTWSAVIGRSVAGGQSSRRSWRLSRRCAMVKQAFCVRGLYVAWTRPCRPFPHSCPRAAAATPRWCGIFRFHFQFHFHVGTVPPLQIHTTSTTLHIDLFHSFYSSTWSYFPRSSEL